VMTRNGPLSPSSVDSLSTITSRHLRRSILTPSPLRSPRSLTSSLRELRENSPTRP
jgi:hypothetical protein